MKKIFTLCIVLIYCHVLNAQQADSANAVAAQGAIQNVPAPTATNATGMTAADSLKLAVANLKAAFQLLGGKRDTMTISIADIDYDNINLAQLKDDLKKAKGVRSVVMHYNGTTATMDVTYKGKPTDIWDNLPATAKSAFKVAELGDTIIRLTCKQKVQ